MYTLRCAKVGKGGALGHFPGFYATYIRARLTICILDNGKQGALLGMKVKTHKAAFHLGVRGLLITIRLKQSSLTEIHYFIEILTGNPQTYKTDNSVLNALIGMGYQVHLHLLSQISFLSDQWQCQISKPAKKKMNRAVKGEI